MTERRADAPLRPLGDRDVIPFRPHGFVPRLKSSLESYDLTGDSPVEDLRKYKHASETNDDFRHRVLVNLLAATVVIVLMVIGSWMADTIMSSRPR
jgi:hypothetical protein